MANGEEREGEANEERGKNASDYQRLLRLCPGCLESQRMDVRVM